MGGRRVVNEWALVKNGNIARVITTAMGASQVQKNYPDHEVVDIYSLPPDVQERYQYWRERP